MSKYMRGKAVSESEAATGLGFSDVFEMRRWETEMGQRFMEVEAKLAAAERERDSFLWHGKRMQVVLEKIQEDVTLPDLLALATAVVLGKGVDWKHQLKGWFKDK